MRRTASGCRGVQAKRALSPEAPKPEWKRIADSHLRPVPVPCRDKSCPNMVYLKNKRLCEVCRDERVRSGKSNTVKSMQNGAYVPGDCVAKGLKKENYLTIHDIQTASPDKAARIIDRILGGRALLSGY